MSHNITLELGDNQVPLVVPDCAILYQVQAGQQNAATGKTSYGVKIWYYTEDHLRNGKKIWEVATQIFEEERKAGRAARYVVIDPRTQGTPDECKTVDSELYAFQSDQLGYWEATDSGSTALDLLAELGQSIADAKAQAAGGIFAANLEKKQSTKGATQVVQDKR